MIHPAKNPQPNGFDLATFAPSLDGVAGEALGTFLSDFQKGNNSMPKLPEVTVHVTTEPDPKEAHEFKASSEDGVANAAIAEAGNRLADLEEELERSNKFLEDAKAAFKAKVDVLEADLDRYRQMVSPANAIDLGEFLGPVKPCPFCGSVALERDGFEEHIICKNCGASAPVGGWQFRAPQP